MLRREFRNLGKKLQKSPNNCNLLHAFSQAKKQFHKTCKQLKYSFYKSVAKAITKLNPNGTKNFWNSLKSNMQNHIEAESPIKMVNLFRQFHTLLNSCDYDTGIDIHFESGKNNPLDFPFTPKEVQVGISNLKSGKCSGLDLIPNEFIKVSADIFLPILVKLLKSSSDWQNARVMEPFIDYNLV